MRTGRQQCKATTLKGSPCRSFVYRDGYCLVHHPDPAERDAHRARQSQGGRNRANYRRAARELEKYGAELSVEALPAVLRTVLMDVIEGKIDPAVGSAAATVAQAAARLHQSTELEARIAALEHAQGLSNTPAPTPLRRIS